MHRVKLSMLIVAAVALICWVSPVACADEAQFTGVVIGRTGEFLQISVPQPVREGSLFGIKLLEADRPIADVKVVSCTDARPYVALARVVRLDFDQTIPLGVKAYADTQTLVTRMPEPRRRSKSPDRFSLQAGVFHPSEASVRESTQEYWQTYRLNYSMIRVHGLETLLSVEYGRAESEGPTSVTTEIVPVTLLGKIRPLRVGNTRLFLAAGAGMYGIRSTAEATGLDDKTDRTEQGVEYGIGLESSGWVAELRYRDVENTSIQGYSFTLGMRF